VRGIFGGKRDVGLEATAKVNPTAQPSLEVNSRSSNTLQRRDFDTTEALHAQIIQATVEAIAEGSGPRLGGSRLLP
jgi:hypothetical protein